MIYSGQQCACAGMTLVAVIPIYERVLRIGQIVRLSGF